MRVQSLNRCAPEQFAHRYAEQLLAALGLKPQRPLMLAEEHPALSWAGSGLMSLTGCAGGPPRMCPLPLAACADGVMAALASVAATSCLEGLRGSHLLTERAVIAGLSRQGAIAPGGSCRLLAAANGGIAINLARADDWQLLPAWLECAVPADWDALATELRRHTVDTLIERGRLLGLAVAADRRPQNSDAPWFSCHVQFPHWHRTQESRRPLVVDLSSLWAGPLCSHLLQKMGADVIKVESLHRLDGARAGSAAFFDLLNAGKRSIALDTRTVQGRGALRALLARADLVIEASRPRALRQLGIRAEELLAENPRLSWLAISGYGRGEPQEGWVAFGDDAGVAAGLSNTMFEATGEHLFVGDAIADPLTGLHATLLGWCALQGSGGQLLAVSMMDVVRQVSAFQAPASAYDLKQRLREWECRLNESGCSPKLPAARPAEGRAAALGADTAAILLELGITC